MLSISHYVKYAYLSLGALNAKVYNQKSNLKSLGRFKFDIICG